MIGLPDNLRARFQAELGARAAVHRKRMDWDAERVADHQQSALRRLLAHAISHSPFHSRRLQGIEPEQFEIGALQTLPTMSKAEMMAAYDEVVTDRCVRLRDVQAHLQRTGTYPELLDGRFFVVATGGSSGRKGVFVYDWNAMVDFGARMLVSAGPPAAGNQVVAAVGSPGAIHILRLGFALVDGERFRIVNTPVTLPLPEIVHRLNEHDPDVLFGYPAMLFRLAIEQEAGRLSIRPNRIRSGGATISPDAEARIAAVFGAPVIDTYGATEGIVGTRDAGAASFTFASDLAVIELVDEEYRSVPDGTPSAKVLLTNLFNLAQPLIRYELEDRFVRTAGVSATGHLVASVEGRAMQEFHYGEKCVYPGGVITKLLACAAVVDYQVRQTPRGIDVDLLTWTACNTAAIARRIKQVLKESGLTTAQVSVRRVQEFDVDPATGKHSRVVSLNLDRRAVPTGRVAG